MSRAEAQSRKEKHKKIFTSLREKAYRCCYLFVVAVAVKLGARR